MKATNKGLRIFNNKRKNRLEVSFTDDLVFTGYGIAAAIERIKRELEEFGFGLKVSAGTHSTSLHMSLCIHNEMTEAVRAGKLAKLRNLELVDILRGEGEYIDGEQLEVLFINEEAGYAAIDPAQPLTMARLRRDLLRLRKYLIRGEQIYLNFIDDYLAVKCPKGTGYVTALRSELEPVFEATGTVKTFVHYAEDSDEVHAIGYLLNLPEGFRQPINRGEFEITPIIHGGMRQVTQGVHFVDYYFRDYDPELHWLRAVQLGRIFGVHMLGPLKMHTAARRYEVYEPSAISLRHMEW